MEYLIMVVLFDISPRTVYLLPMQISMNRPDWIFFTHRVIYFCYKTPNPHKSSNSMKMFRLSWKILQIKERKINLEAILGTIE